jgi:hypothetical protein
MAGRCRMVLARLSYIVMNGTFILYIFATDKRQLYIKDVKN